MKPAQTFDLGPLRSARAAYDKLVSEKQELEETKQELERAIEADKKSGAFDDPKIVARLSGNKSRLEMIPARLAQINGKISEASRGVQEQLSSATYHVAQCYREVHNAYEKKVRDFFHELSVPGHRASELVREIVNMIPEVQQAEATKNSFGLPSVQRDSSLIFSMASRAEELISQWQKDSAE